MLELLGADENMPFAIALGVMTAITVLELLGVMFGTGLSSLFGSILPEGMEAGMDFDSTSTLGSILSWLRVGQVPVIMLLILFLASFGLAGLMMQQILATISGYMLPALPASVLAFSASLPAVRFSGGILHRIMPKDETTAVSQGSFIGRVAVLTLGTATAGNAAQAKLRDAHGQDHYIMVEPDNKEDQFSQGDAVLLVRHTGACFYVIAADHSITGDENEQQ